MLTVMLVLYKLHVTFFKENSNSKTKKNPTTNPKKLKIGSQPYMLEATGDYIRKKSKKIEGN